MRLSRWLPRVVGLLVGVVVPTASGHAQSLDEVLAKAYATNPQLLAERAKVRAIDEEVPQALANWRPKVTATGEFGSGAFGNNLASNPTDRDQHRDPRSLGFTVDQPLYRGGRTLAAIGKAENDVKAARARLLAVEQTVLQDAATTFVDVLRDQAVLDLATNNEQVLRRHLDATRDRFQVGEITRTDVSQAEARLAKATADRIKAEADLAVSRAAYVNVIGEAPGGLVEPTLPSDLPASVTEAVHVAADQAPAVVAGRYDEAAQSHATEQVRGELLPELSLEGTAKREFDSTGEVSRVDTYKGLLTLTVPLYQAGGTYSRLRAAKQTLAQRRLTTDLAQRDAIESATQTWQLLQAERARIAAFRSQIEADKVALEGVQREAAVGSRTVLDVLDAEQELLDAQVNLVRARRDEMVDILKLKVALGQMTARHLGLPVDFYDPDRHYREVRDRWFGGSSSGEVEPVTDGQPTQ